MAHVSREYQSTSHSSYFTSARCTPYASFEPESPSHLQCFHADIINTTTNSSAHNSTGSAPIVSHHSLLTPTSPISLYKPPGSAKSSLPPNNTPPKPRPPTPPFPLPYPPPPTPQQTSYPRTPMLTLLLNAIHNNLATFTAQVPASSTVPPLDVFDRVEACAIELRTATEPSHGV